MLAAIGAQFLTDVDKLPMIKGERGIGLLIPPHPRARRGRGRGSRASNGSRGIPEFPVRDQRAGDLESGHALPRTPCRRRSLSRTRDAASQCPEPGSGLVIVDEHTPSKPKGLLDEFQRGIDYLLRM